MLSANPSPVFSSLSNDPDMEELIEVFVDDLKDRVRSLEVAYAANNVQELTRLAHQLKGASGGFGFDGLGEMAGDLEESAQAADSVTELARELEELISMCRRVTAEPAPPA